MPLCRQVALEPIFFLAWASRSSFPAFVVNILVCGLFAGLGWFARKGHVWAFIVGIILYALDAMIFLLAKNCCRWHFHGYICSG